MASCLLCNGLDDGLEAELFVCNALVFSDRSAKRLEWSECCAAHRQYWGCALVRFPQAGI
jgi:hypothetical protein